MTRNLDKAADGGIQKATNTWKHVRREIFRNKAFNRKIKIMIWKSLIRSSVIYGLRTRDLPRNPPVEIEIYMFKQIK